MKKILVATGSSENKKNFAVGFIKDYMGNKGVGVEVTGVNIYEVKMECIDADLIVTIGPCNFDTNIPIIQGTAFLTKMGMDRVCDSMIEKLK